MLARDMYSAQFGAYVYYETGSMEKEARVQSREDAYPFQEIVGSNGPYAFLGKCHAVLGSGEYRVCVIGSCLAVVRYMKWKAEKIEIFYYDLGKGELDTKFVGNDGLSGAVYAVEQNGVVDVFLREDYYAGKFQSGVSQATWRAQICIERGSGFDDGEMESIQ